MSEAVEEAGENGPQVDCNIEDQALKESIIAAMREIYDPEIPVNIYDLGLIYGFNIDSNNTLKVTMTLTAPGCPVAETFPGEIAKAICEATQVKDTQVEVVWDPPWSMDRMSEEARLMLNLY